MKAKKCMTASLAVAMMTGIMTGISVTGCKESGGAEPPKATQQTGTGKTAAGPAFAAKAVQMWSCELDKNASEAQVMEAAGKWLAAARKMKGGENLEAYVNFPVAVTFPGQSDLFFVVVAPSFKEWGKFWDGHKGSAADAVEEASNEFLICPDSALWESVKVTTGETRDAVGPTFAGKAMQMWKCELDDKATEAQMMEGARKWLAAARTMKGGENLDLYVNFPVAVNDTGNSDLVLVCVAPSFEEWGVFWDGYGGSPAAAVEAECNAFVVCPDSAVWESFKVTAP